MIEDKVPPTAAPPGVAIRKRSVKIAGHSTSLSMEGVFWDALKEVAAGRGLSLNALIEEIDRGRGTNLSSAVRVYLLNHFRVALRLPVSPPAPSGDSSGRP
ncbi:MAG: ribbon-helix-helix domain-containing protein [Kiloniellaceae bacterium]